MSIKIGAARDNFKPAARLYWPIGANLLVKRI